MGWQHLRRAADAAGVALSIALSFVLIVASGASVQSLHAQAVVRGTLYDDASGTPLRGTVMLIDPATDAPVVYKATDSLGWFSLEAKNGTYRIAAIHPGYKSILSAPVSLVNNERLTVRVPIAAAGDPAHRIGVLEHVRGDTLQASVTRAASPEMERYAARRAVGNGLHYDRAQMERSNVTTLGEFLQTVPGMSVTDPASTSSVQLMRNVAMNAGAVPGVAASACRLGWFLDGVRVDIPGTSDPMTDALGSMQIQNLTAIEVFRGLSEMPSEFAAPDLRCGAVAIWTRKD